MGYTAIISGLAALLTPVIGITTAYIAYQQYKTNKVRLKYELYERRIVVFRGVLAHLSSIMRQGRVKEVELVELVKSTGEKEFLFSKDVCDLINDIYDRSVKMLCLDDELKDMAVGEERSRLVKEHGELFRWMVSLLPEIRGKFKNYLNIS